MKSGALEEWVRIMAQKREPWGRVDESLVQFGVELVYAYEEQNAKIIINAILADVEKLQDIDMREDLDEVWFVNKQELQRILEKALK